MATRICPQCGTESQAPFCRADGFATVDSARYLARDLHSREGETIATRYRLDQAIGKTSLGSVYRATDMRLGAHVAVRLLAPGLASDLGLIARFQREGRLVASLAHPNIVHVMEHGVAEDGTLFIAEELVAGPTLAEALSRSGPFDPSQVVALGREIFDALAEAHTHGVLHRSLGLDNIVLVTRPGGGESLKIGDFGLVHVLADDNAQPFIYPQVLSGAWRGMAPEQARGRGVSGHGDLYSVGCILYELLSGRPVFGDGAPTDLLVAHSVKLPPPLEREGRMLAGPLVELIMRCLEKKPWNRPDGAQKALDLLELCRAQPLLPSASPTAEFAAPPANTGTQQRVKPRTNPYGYAAPTSGRTNPSLQAADPTSFPTDPKGMPRPQKPQRHTREQPRPKVQAAEARPSGLVHTRSERASSSIAPTPEAPLAMSEPTVVIRTPGGSAPGASAGTSAPGASAARAESNDLGFASRADLPLPGREPGAAESARRRSPIWWFIAGVALAALVAFLLTSMNDGSSSGLALPQAVAVDVAAPATVQPVAPDAAPVAETRVAALDVVEAPDVEAPDAEVDAVETVEVALAVAEVQAPEVVAAEVQVAAAVQDAVTPVVEPKLAKPEPTKPESPKVEKDPKKDKKAPVDPLADLEDPELRTAKVEAPLHKVLIDTEPIGAKIWVGGRVVGETPVYVEWQGGGVDVLVAKVGYRPVRQRLGASTGASLRFTLVPAN